MKNQKKFFIIANWKMNPSNLDRAKKLFLSLKNAIKSIKNEEIIICPPFIYLSEFFCKSKGIKYLKLGSQDVFWEKEGAFTGEISPVQLKNTGCEYVIIGHSERRRFIAETDEMINKKIKAVFKEKLKPILCIGESEIERRKGRTWQVLRKQLKKGLKQVGAQLIKNIIIAYEPVWAIGTGEACSISDAKKVRLFIEKMVGEVPILYGGSVNSKNVKGFVKEAGFDGVLVGGASLKSSEFISIIKKVETII